MNIINRLILFIKNVFPKKEKINMLNAPVSNSLQGKRDGFIKSLKVVTDKKNTTKKVETLICEGDGLGIQKRISS